jgi:hypothetical protein
MNESLETQPPPLHPAHRRQVNLLSGLMHAGLIMIGLSAVWTLQPAMTPRHWAAYVLVALVMLACVAVTRGRCGFQDGGKLLTALGAALVLRLARDPQLAAIPALSESMPAWLGAVSPGLGTLGLLLAAICGFLFVRTLNNFLGHGHQPLFVSALSWGSALILVLALVTFFTLRRFYELDVTYLSLLIAGIIQYYLLIRLALSTSGRMTVGAAPQIYLALAILLACGHNLLAGMVMGGEGP